ncbi:hypothetical protein BV25DRAFT_1843120 [Artomyces pyxidatus]|uniref:Uncharacterized protein n=1 Tax=Artomyces pyxidatus TaxID=48021 RepID=A0ACB8SH70_9AGAM|nr:hypothetical protein BV25DRAFT_1843120 [Artomyces pyxidatus]
MRYLDTEGISVGTPANVPSEHASSTPNARITEAAQAAALDPDRQSVTWPSVRARPNLAGLFTIALSLLFHRAFFVDAGLLFAKRQKVPVGEDINLRNSAVYILGTLYSAWNRRAADGFELGCVEQDGAHDMFAKPFVVDLLCDMFIGFRRACRDRWVSLVYTVKLDPFGLKLGWENRWDIAVNASESLEGYSFITKEQLGVRSSSTSLTIVGPHPDFGSPRVLTVCKDVFFVNRHIVNMDPLVVAFDRSKTILCEDIICRFAGTYEGYATAVPNSMIAITSAIAAVMLDNVSTFHASYRSMPPTKEFTTLRFTPEKIRVHFALISKKMNTFLSVHSNLTANNTLGPQEILLNFGTCGLDFGTPNQPARDESVPVPDDSRPAPPVASSHNDDDVAGAAVAVLPPPLSCRQYTHSVGLSLYPPSLLIRLPALLVSPCTPACCQAIVCCPQAALLPPADGLHNCGRALLLAPAGVPHHHLFRGPSNGPPLTIVLMIGALVAAATSRPRFASLYAIGIGGEYLVSR